MFKALLTIFLTRIVALHGSYKGFFRISYLNHDLFTSRVLCRINHEGLAFIDDKIIVVIFFKNGPALRICFSPAGHYIEVDLCRSGCFKSILEFLFIYNIINGSIVETTSVDLAVKLIKRNDFYTVFYKVLLSKDDVSNFLVLRVIDVL